MNNAQILLLVLILISAVVIASIVYMIKLHIRHKEIQERSKIRLEQLIESYRVRRLGNLLEPIPISQEHKKYLTDEIVKGTKHGYLWY